MKNKRALLLPLSFPPLFFFPKHRHIPLIYFCFFLFVSDSYEFKNADVDTLTISAHGVEKKYTKLNLMEFDSTRKRMSCILRCPDGKIRIFTKGADNIMFERLNEHSIKEKMPAMLEHLGTYARDGLRTLVLGQKVRRMCVNIYKYFSGRKTKNR